MSQKHKKVWTTLNYFEHFFLSASAVTECILISAFDFIVGIPIVITNSAVGLKICAITGGTEKYKSTMKKKRSMISIN